MMKMHQAVARTHCVKENQMECDFKCTNGQTGDCGDRNAWVGQSGLSLF